MDSFNTFFIPLIFSLIGGLKPALFWTYLGQLKEYRLDRFWTDYGELKKIFRFYLFSGGRKFYQPKWTLKSSLIFLLSIISFPVIYILLFSKINLYFLWWLILAYFLAPLLVLFWIFVLHWPSILIKEVIYFLARQKINSFKNLLVIGITGSYGKTSTKELLTQILAQKFKVISTPGNVNTEIGLALFILKTNFKQKSVFIVEMGAYRLGEIKKTCWIANPKIGVLTGLCEQHLALFGSFENIKQAKMELINSLPTDGLAVFNGDDKNVLILAQNWNRKKIIYSAQQVQEFNFSWPNYYRTNLAGAITIAQYFQMSNQEIKSALNYIQPNSQIVQVKKGKGGVTIIDNSYNANPTGILANLKYLKNKFSNKKKIIIFPCLIELGQKSSEIHFQIGQEIAQTCDQIFITNSKCFSDIKTGALKENFLEKNIILIKNSSQLLKLIKDDLNSQTAIFIAGRISKEIKNILL